MVEESYLKWGGKGNRGQTGWGLVGYMVRTWRVFCLCFIFRERKERGGEKETH